MLPLKFLIKPIFFIKNNIENPYHDNNIYFLEEEEFIFYIIDYIDFIKSKYRLYIFGSK